MIELPLADVRRIAVAAQGLAARRPARVDRRTLRAMFDRLAVVQLDSVNVLARSHYLVTWARVGDYAPATLDALSHTAPRALFEYWGHEASLMPVDLYPHLRWRMARAKDEAWGRMRAISRRRAFVAKVLAAVAAQGPVRAGELAVEAKRATERGWWAWSDAKTAIEWLFWSGQVTAAGREHFERLYDLPARVIPDAAFATTSTIAASIDALLERSARAIGIGTEGDLRDYFRLPVELARPGIARLVRAGVLEPVRVPGWKPLAYRHHGAPRPVDAERDALLSPFDNLIWTRDRTLRLFGMKFRLEVYTPAEKRVHGYYVLAFLQRGELVARVDLKADRAARTLRVQSAHLEAGRVATQVAPALAAELHGLARWLGLADVLVVDRGDLAPALARAS